MAFHTIWSVDLGKSALKAVRLRRDGNNLEILAVDKIDYTTAHNGLSPGDDAATEGLAVFHSRNDVRDPLVVAHPGQGTFSRFIKVPAFDEKKVQDMVQYEASQQIPFPLDEVIWDFHLVEREYVSGEERDIGLFAVRREAIDDFLLDFVQEGFSVEMLPIGYLALFNYIKYDLNPDEPAVVLDIGAAHTDLILIDGERFWVRPLPHSGQDVTQAIMQRFKLKFSEAEKLKTAVAKQPKQAVRIFQAVFQPKLKELVQEINRSIGYYRSQAGEVKFTRLYLLGNGSRIVGIKKYMQEQLSMPVERVQSIQHMRISRDVNVRLLQSQLMAFGTALGAGIQALGLGTCQVDLVPREEKLKKAAERKKKHVYFAAAILLACILLSYAMIQGKVSDAEHALQMARALPTEQIRPWEREYTDYEGRLESPVLAQKRLNLLRVGELRQASLESLRLFDGVLAKLPNANVVDESVPVDDDDAVVRAREEGLARLDEKLWIPWFRMLFIEWPEEVTTPGTRAARARPGSRAPRSDKVPGYKCSAYAMITQRGSAIDSIGLIEERLQEPLREALGHAEFTVRKEIKLDTGAGQLPALLYQVGKLPSGSVEQVGRPFFGAPLTWYILPRAPEKDEAEDGEGEDDEEDDTE